MSSNPKSRLKWSNSSLDQGFSFCILKNKNSVFKRWILLILSMNSHFQRLLGRRNEYRGRRKQEIQGFQNIRECSFCQRIWLKLTYSLIVRFASLSLINSLEETLRCKMSRISPVGLIKDGALKFCHITCEE